MERKKRGTENERRGNEGNPLKLCWCCYTDGHNFLFFLFFFEKYTIKACPTEKLDVLQIYCF